MPEAERPNPFIISSAEDALALEQRIQLAATSACIALSELMSEHHPLEVLRALKFGQLGFTPFDPSKRINFLDQVHQTFRHLVTVRATEYLIDNHPAHAPYAVSIGGNETHDIESIDGKVIAETVAVITTANNNKIRFDLERAKESAADHRYLFYAAEVDGEAPSDPDVQVVALSL